MPDNFQPDIHLNLNVRGLPVSATLGINELSHKLIKEGKRIFKLGLGQSPFPVPTEVENELKQNAFQKDYLPVLGLRSLQQAVADYHSRAQGLAFSADHIMIGPGSKELMFILQLVYYGDLVIPTPSWVSYAPQAHIIGRHIQWLKTDRDKLWKVTPDALEQLCRQDPNKPRLIILNYPSNPHGYTYTEAELRDIAKVAKKYKMLVLSDEIYGELHFEGKHISIARFYPEGTIVSGGLSKWCGAGGWRLGTFAFPKNLQWLLSAMATVASETYTSTSAPIQYAAVRAFQGGLEIERYLVHSRRILAGLARSLTDKLRSAGFDIKNTQGGFYLFPDFSPFAERLNKKGITTSTQLCEKVLSETGVAMLPGVSFGRPDDELTVRLAFVDFDGAKAIAASEQCPIESPLPDDYYKTYCFSCVTAVDALCQWVST